MRKVKFVSVVCVKYSCHVIGCSGCIAGLMLMGVGVIVDEGCGF